MEIVHLLINSLFVYKMQSLPIISRELEMEFGRLVTNFIWNGRRPKIRRDILELRKESGGRKLGNLRIRDKSLIINWARRLIQDYPVFQALVYHLLNLEITDDTIGYCNLSPDGARQQNCKSGFWKEVLATWCKFNFLTPKSESEMENQIIWFNSFIKIEGNAIFNKKMHENGITKILDLTRDGKFLMHLELMEWYGNVCTLIQYN